MKPTQKIETFYTHLFSTGFFIVDEKEPYFQEKVLQIIWNEQILTQNLATESGESLEIIHQGIWNIESGPDFHDAVISVNGKIKQGSVEIHFNPEDWTRHHHHVNPEYQKVVLHSVWNNPSFNKESPKGVPLFSISKFLGAPIDKILSEINFNSYTYAKKISQSKYAKTISKLDDSRLSRQLQSHGISRILKKAHNHTKNIEKFGLDNAAYHALFDGMGYKNNRKPFRELASLIPLEQLSSAEENIAISVLFGASGLLPDPTQDRVHPDNLHWVLKMWSIWWTRRRGYRPLPWNKHRYRPYNSPERRLLAAYFVLSKNSFKLGRMVVDTIRQYEDTKKCITELQNIFTVSNADPAFLNFLDFSKTLAKPVALLGKSRINDLIVNFAFPFYFAYCLINQDPDQCLKGKKFLLQLPCLQDNRVLKEAVHHFLSPPSRKKHVITNACAQQGMIELYKRALRDLSRD